MANNNYTFFADPGHGWLRVPLSEISALGLTGKVSGYSYKQGKYGYLEEDCDADLFLKAYKAAGHTFTLTHHHTNNDSQIRRYNRFA